MDNTLQQQINKLNLENKCLIEYQQILKNLIENQQDQIKLLNENGTLTTELAKNHEGRIAKLEKQFEEKNDNR